MPRHVTLLLLWCLLSSLTQAQRPFSRPDELSGLRVGQRIPDLRVYDEHGRERALHEVRGGHTVLIFGCLT